MEVPYHINEEIILALIGAELSYCGIGKLRCGYRMNISERESEDSTFKVGIGFNWNKYTLDYSIGIAGHLENPHNISFKLEF